MLAIFASGAYNLTVTVLFRELAGVTVNNRRESNARKHVSAAYRVT